MPAEGGPGLGFAGPGKFYLAGQHGLKTFAAIRSPDAQFTLIKDGDHRLSRDRDIMAIHRAAEELAANHPGKEASNDASPSR